MPKKISKKRAHRPSFGRHLMFEVIIIIEMVVMLYYIETIDNPMSLINKDVRKLKKSILLITTALYITSLGFKLLYYQLHQWPLKSPTIGQLLDILFEVLQGFGVVGYVIAGVVGVLVGVLLILVLAALALDILVDTTILNSFWS